MRCAGVLFNLGVILVPLRGILKIVVMLGGGAVNSGMKG
jgi:hypothetical protein